MKDFEGPLEDKFWASIQENYMGAYFGDFLGSTFGSLLGGILGANFGGVSWRPSWVLFLRTFLGSYSVEFNL